MASMPNRPDYIERRRHVAEERRAHLKQAPKGCRCVWCVGPAGVQRALDEILVAQEERNGPAPF